MKTALLTGITGQDGSYMADLLLANDYRVYGVVRRTSTGNRKNIEHLQRFERDGQLILLEGDVMDAGSVNHAFDRVVNGMDGTETGPLEVYHFADQDHVGTSFACPRLSVDVTFGGAMNVLDAANKYRTGPIGSKLPVRVFQPASATMFGPGATVPQDENTPLNPQSPYAVAKAAAYHLAWYYRKTHGLWVSTAILYSHDSPRRSRDYLLQRIVTQAMELQQTTSIGQIAEFAWTGDLEQLVEVGAATDYVEAIHAILQLPEPDDFVIGQGWHRAVKVRTLIETVCRVLELQFRVVSKWGASHRPGQPETLIADYGKACRTFNYVPKTSLTQLIESIVSKRVSEGQRSW